MLWRNTESTEKPSKVTIGTMPEGNRFVRLADNIREEMRTEAGGEEGQATEQKVYIYDEVQFELEAEREETERDIQRDFEGWWEYGSQEESGEPTLEERVAAIEDFLLEM